MGAYALRRYILLGVVRGINSHMIADIEANGMFKDFEQEIYRRKTEKVACIKWGEREKLEKKELFIKEYGFSPDVLDCMFQAAYYMWVFKGMPLDKPTYLDGYREDKPIEIKDNNKEQIEELNSIWEDDVTFNNTDTIEDDSEFAVYSELEEDW